MDKLKKGIEDEIGTLIPKIERLSKQKNVTLWDLGFLVDCFPRRNVFSVNIYMKSNDKKLESLHFFQSKFPRNYSLNGLYYIGYDLYKQNAKMYDLYIPQIRGRNFHTEIQEKHKKAKNTKIKETIDGFFKGKPGENGLEIKAIHITAIHRYGKITANNVKLKTEGFPTSPVTGRKNINVIDVLYENPVCKDRKEEIMLKIDKARYVPISICYDPSAYQNTNELENNLKTSIAKIINFADDHERSKDLIEKELILLFPNALLTFYHHDYGKGYDYYNINAKKYTYTDDIFNPENIWNWYMRFCTRKYNISYSPQPEEFIESHYFFKSKEKALNIVMLNPEQKKDNKDEKVDKKGGGNENEKENKKMNQMKNTKTKNNPIKIPQPNQKTPIKTPDKNPIKKPKTPCCNCCQCGD